MRQPITDANIIRHHDAVVAALAAGEIALSDIRPAAATTLRDTREEMIQFFLENPQCTREDMALAGFDDRQIERWGNDARREAQRRWSRSAA
ncbi:hypothetical protein [Rhizobium sp. G21]|uniref:hypothetical protein n=1 Tax=Rhizobium sp. G21 TaxID=2758439 RepID=UPI001600AE60|nr:hypothetical protein [Rhizobium sp. G21]MBB1247430.1 hypothetical protein [Rhizobium sp. G21]